MAGKKHGAGGGRTGRRQRERLRAVTALAGPEPTGRRAGPTAEGFLAGVGGDLIRVFKV